MTRRDLLQKIATIGSVSVLTAALAACGKKADPKPPNPDQTDYPRKYPPK